MKINLAPPCKRHERNKRDTNHYYCKITIKSGHSNNNTICDVTHGIFKTHERGGGPITGEYFLILSLILFLHHF